VVGAYTRECLALPVDTSFASRRVTRVLDELIAQRGAPLAIRCDNGPELTSRHFLAWGIEQHIELLHIQPGKARRKIAAWQKEYNQERPHSSLGYRTSHEFSA